MRGDRQVRIGFRLLALGSWLLACGCAVHAAEDPTAPVLPKETDTPPPPGPERPKLRHWLDEPAGEPAARDKDVPPSEGKSGAVPNPAAEDEAAARKALQADVKAKLERARLLLKQGAYQETINLAREALNLDPRNILAAELLRKAQGKILDTDEAVTQIASERRDREAILEASQHAVRPPPRLKSVRPHFERRGEDPATPRYRKMAERLEQPVTVDFMKADLEWVLNTLFILTGVNIIADQAALEGKSLTLHVEDVPLKEVLNFIVRNNDGIQFSVTEDAVWITASEATDLKKIMYPRIYPIHYGLVSTTEGTGGGAGQRSSGTGRAGGGARRGGGGGGGGRGGGGAGGQTGQQEPSYLETVLAWMKDAKDPQTFPDGSDYLVDRQSNHLIVFTTAAGHEAMGRFLDYFDQPAIQVLIKARFLKIQGENEKQMGVGIDKLSTRIGHSIIGTQTQADSTTGDGTTATGVGHNPFREFSYTSGTGVINPGKLGAGSLLTIIGRRTDPQFQLTLSALLNDKQTKVLSEPQVLAINNKAAMIDITTHFSYITDLRPVTTYNYAGQGTAIENVPSFVPEFDEDVIGFTLEVTPSVGRDLKTINLHLSPVIDSLSEGQQISQFQNFDASIGSQNAAGQATTIQRPTIDQTSLETDVVLEDNGYCIIGGLIRTDRTLQDRKIPGLHRIPYLGNLFKTTSTTVTRSNMMIIVEAQIITPGGRTYYKDDDPDDAEPREGGTNRSPGQTSELIRPENVNSALGLAQREPGRPSVPLTASRRPARPARPGGSAAPVPPGTEPGVEPDRPTRPTPVSPEPAVAVAEALGNTPARQALTARERMERLARASRANALPVAASMPGWTVAKEEREDEALPVRGEVVAPPNE